MWSRVVRGGQKWLTTVHYIYLLNRHIYIKCL
nr:MAG TPA: hypothetical protein [Caudoviricetes sp.]